MDELKHLVSNKTEYRNVSHIFRGNFAGAKGRDMCLETFGKQDEECIEYNKKLTNPLI